MATDNKEKSNKIIYCEIKYENVPLSDEFAIEMLLNWKS